MSFEYNLESLYGRKIDDGHSEPMDKNILCLTQEFFTCTILGEVLSFLPLQMAILFLFRYNNNIIINNNNLKIKKFLTMEMLRPGKIPIIMSILGQ